MPFGTRAPRRLNRCGSCRNSTTSVSSAAASSTPATSFQVTADFDDGSTTVGLTRGISWSVRQSRKTSAPKKTSGSQVRSPFWKSSNQPARTTALFIGRQGPGL